MYLFEKRFCPFFNTRLNYSCRKPARPAASKPSPSGGEKLLRLLSREVESADANSMPTAATAPSSGSVAAFFANATRQEQTPFGNFVMGGEKNSESLAFRHRVAHLNQSTA